MTLLENSYLIDQICQTSYRIKSKINKDTNRNILDLAWLPMTAWTQLRIIQAIEESIR